MSERTNSPERAGLDIAVVGLAGRFPGAEDVGRLWENVKSGIESITHFSDEELIASGIDSSELADPNYVRAAGVLDGVERFDARFFGYSAREAALMDPQQRVFLEITWAALESAGCDPARFPGVVGVYAGSGLNSYLLRHVLPSLPRQSELDYQAVLTNDKDFLCTRASYKLGLEGPSVVVQTACSTSLVAVHLACQALASGECDLALAGGVSIRLPQKAGYLFQEEGILSPDGHCRAFDAGARGCVPGSGVAVVTLKRLPDAVREGDVVHAVIRGTAINNDGSSKMGYTAPRAEGQSQVIRSALSVAEVSADTIGSVEAHGTGTILGDPIEVQGLTRAFEPDTRRRGFCALGSVKTNLGHLDVAAGVAGLIKAALTVRDGLLVPSLHFETPNPQIDFAASPFYVNTQLREWPGPGPRRAGVSSFGIGGTNAHVVVEEPPPRAEKKLARRPEVLVLSAKTEAALAAACANLADHLRSHPKTDVGDVAFTLQSGRAALACRRSLVGADAEEVVAALEAPPSPGPDLGASEARPEVAFLFPGQGSQYPGMGEGLYRTRPEFRRQVDRASEIVSPRLGLDLRDVLFSPASANVDLSDTRLAQPAIFTVSYALARLWMSFDVQPGAMLGHSVGEYVAACLAGVLSLDDALGLVAERGRLMGGVAGGAMLAVALAAEELEPRLGEHLALAAVNGPGQTVVAGANDAVEDLERTLQQQGVESRRLRTSHAFHSSMMEPILAPFTEVVEKVSRSSPRIPYLSNVTGRWVTDEDVADPTYWARHLRQTVRFSAGLERLLERPHCAFLEVGPGHTLTSLARRHRVAGRIPLAVASLPRAQEETADEAALLEAVGRLWTAGVAPDWSVAGAQGRRRVVLPTYPFERHRHWLGPKPPTGAASPAAEEDRRSAFRALSWQRLPTPPKGDGRREAFAVFADRCGFGAALAARLREDGRPVTTVSAGSAFGRVGENDYEIEPRCRADYDALFAALELHEGESLHVVHCLTVEPDSAVRTDLGGLEHNEDLAFFSLLFAVQALGAREEQTPCRLTVVTSQVHEVTGEETLCPAKAAVLGPCRVAPLEYPGFECRQIDIIPPAAGVAPTRRLLDRLLDALDLGPGPAVMALRGSHLWHQTSAPLSLESGPTSALKQGGVYLITGGLGGIGLALAEDLARTVKARLVLLGRTALPPRDEWDAWLDPRAPIDFERAVAGLAHLEKESVGHAPESPMTRLPDLPGALDRLSAGYVLDLLAEARIDTAREWGVAELRDAVGVKPGFFRLFDAMLRMVAEDGFASLDDGATVRFLGRSRWPDADSLRRTAARRHPSYAPVLDLLHHCARRHLQALRGEIPARGVLYGEPGRELFKAGSECVLTHSSLPAQQEVIRSLLVNLAGEERRRTLRVLEVGGGEGILTRTLVPAHAGHDVEYHFTDIGRSFVVNAEREAATRGHGFMRFGVLDIARAPEEQGYGRGGFDVVLAFNVVHATPSVRKTLAHLRELLAPGGMLVLHESVRLQRWVDLVWGLTEEWWAFEDGSLRRHSPLLDLDSWMRVLAEQGFEGIASVPHDPRRRAEADAAVLLARRPAAIEEDHESDAVDFNVEPVATRSKIRKIRELEAQGAEIQVIAADVANRDQMREALDQVHERFRRVDGVIHGALVLNDGAVHLKTREAASSVLAPKVRGTLVLKEVFQDADLDLFVLLSSLVSIRGGKGQVDYCAASNVQDAFAHAEQGRLARVVLSINWPAWREVGRAVREAIRRGERPEMARRDGLSSREGIEAFRLALRSSLSQVLVMPPGELAMGSGRAASEIAGALPPPAARTPETAPPAGAPRSEPERVMAEIWRDLLGVDSISVHDSFFELGGDSVTSLQFVARAKKAGLRFTNRQVFERQTIAGLASLAADAEDRDEGASG